MEIVISVSEVELVEFPEEEAPESSGKQEQSGKTSPIQGTVKSLLSIDTSPTLELLEKIQRGRIAYLSRCTPEGGSNQGIWNHKAAKQPKLGHYSKRPESLAIRKPIKAYKRPGSLVIRKPTILSKRPRLA